MIEQIEQRIEISQSFYEKDEEVHPHSCIWGDFNMSLDGILEYEVNGRKLWSPPSYGIWIPPRVAHHSIAVDQHTTHYAVIRLDPELCENFSVKPEMLSVSVFFRQLILEAFHIQQQGHLHYFRHLLQVILDQLSSAPKHHHYLPQTHHPALKPVLEDLAAPALFQKSLRQVLEPFAISERQLHRISQAELQLSLSEWRSRAKLLYAIMQLRQGKSIKALSFELGYQHSSNFIEFFKRYTGQTPAQFKSCAAPKPIQKLP